MTSVLDQMIKFENVYKKFTSIRRYLTGEEHNDGFCLKNISFSISSGECVSIVGSNGSGKSTLLKLMSSIYQPDQGMITIEGSISPIVNAGQFFDEELNLEENIYLYRSLAETNPSGIPSESLILKSGLDDHQDLPLKYYSTGMTARASFTLGTSFDYDIYLIDEVFSVGDSAFNENCLNRMEELKESGKTIIFVTHDLELASGFSEKVLVLNKGRLMFSGMSSQGVDYYEEGSKEKIFALKKESFKFQEYLLKIAAVSEKKADYEHSEKYYKKIIRNYPVPENLKRAGWFYKRWGKLNIAHELFLKVSETVPEDIESRNEVLEFFEHSGMHDSLLEYARCALLRTPRDTRLHSVLLFYGGEKESSTSAAFLYNHILSHCEDINLLLKIASVLEKSNQYREAEDTARRVLEINPRNRAAKNILGKIEYLRKNFNQAIVVFDELICDQPEDREPYVFKMRCLFESTGDSKILLRHCELMIERFAEIQEFLFIFRYLKENYDESLFVKYISLFKELYPEFGSIILQKF